MCREENVILSCVHQFSQGLALARGMMKMNNLKLFNRQIVGMPFHLCPKSLNIWVGTYTNVVSRLNTGRGSS